MLYTYNYAEKLPARESTKKHGNKPAGESRTRQSSHSHATFKCFAANKLSSLAACSWTSVKLR